MDLKSKIIWIYGPTASGKSKFAVNLAKKINGEIINADSMQVYKELKILSARPYQKDYKKIRHHLYGFQNVKKKFSTGSWLKLANKNILDIKKRNKVPILVGGTGLYFKALTKPSVKALKYKPVPPTRIGVFFLFLTSLIFFIANFNQSPVEKFFLTLWNPYKWCFIFW